MPKIFSVVVPRDNPYFRDHSWHVKPCDFKGIFCEDYDIACEAALLPFIFYYGLLVPNVKFVSLLPDAYELTSSDDDDDDDVNNHDNFSKPFEPAQAAAASSQPQSQLSTRKKKSKIEQGIVFPGQEFDYGKFAERIRYRGNTRAITFGGDNNIPIPTVPPSDGTLSKYGRSKWRDDRSCCCCQRFDLFSCAATSLGSLALFGTYGILVVSSIFMMGEVQKNLGIKDLSSSSQEDASSSLGACIKATYCIPEKVCGVEKDDCKFSIAFSILVPWFFSIGSFVHCYLDSVQIARELRHRQQFDGGMICAKASDPVPTRKMTRAVQQIFSIKELGNTRMKSAFEAWRIIGITMSYLPKDVNRYEIFRNRYPWTHDNPVKVSQME